MNENQMFDLVKKEIDRALKIRKHPRIAICGKCASGKTTLAMKLREYFSADVIHLDDFFLPCDLRTKERLSEIGGNIHYERVKEEVVKGLFSDKKFLYRIFDCKTMDYAEYREINPDNIVIIEGIYALHPKFCMEYDLKIFLEVSDEEQKRRILLRNGEKQAKRFFNEWIPMENKFIDFFDIKRKCDIVI